MPCLGEEDARLRSPLKFGEGLLKITLTYVLASVEQQKLDLSNPGEQDQVIVLAYSIGCH